MVGRLGRCLQRVLALRAAHTRPGALAIARSAASHAHSRVWHLSITSPCTLQATGSIDEDSLPQERRVEEVAPPGREPPRRNDQLTGLAAAREWHACDDHLAVIRSCQCSSRSIPRRALGRSARPPFTRASTRSGRTAKRKVPVPARAHPPSHPSLTVYSLLTTQRLAVLHRRTRGRAAREAEVGGAEERGEGASDGSERSERARE